ncbi:hypothetical protein [Streptomyces sp. NPDC002403]
MIFSSALARLTCSPSISPSHPSCSASLIRAILRHAGISFWLYSGVDPAECARRAGQSIEDLFRHYAKFLDGLREQANRLIEQSMNEWQRVSQGDAPEG